MASACDRYSLGLWEGSDTCLNCNGRIEDTDWREGDGRSVFLRSKSYKTGERLFLRIKKVVAGMYAGYSGNDRSGF